MLSAGPVHLPPEQTISAPYSLPQRVIRTNVFRLATENEGYFERSLMRVYMSCSHKKVFPPMFDPERAERSLENYKALGAEEYFVIPKDKKASVHMIFMESKELEQLIKVHGGSWEKITIQDENRNPKCVFAIIPPNEKNFEWTNFEQSLLKFSWEKQSVEFQNGYTKEIIITCDAADAIPDNQLHQNCFLHTHSTSRSFAGDRARAGFYLGMKQDICFYDNRGLWKSKGQPSEAGFYLDIEAVFDQLTSRKSYGFPNIFLSGSCGGAPISAHLKAKYHDTGIQFIQEQSFTDMHRDFISNLPGLAQYVGENYLDGVLSHDLEDFSGRPFECKFNVEKKWEGLPYFDGHGGKVVLIRALNDERLPIEVHNRYIDLATRVNQSVQSIFFTSPPGIDAHADDFFHYSQARRDFAEAIFN